MKEKTIWVKAPARLHFGFFDLNGGTGRRFGGLGMAINGFDTSLQVARSRLIQASGIDSERAAQYANQLFDRLGLEGGVKIHVHSAIPPHSGLGSGTQMALAVGKAIEALFDVELSVHDIAVRLGRGNRSGIGIGAFEQGGFLVDGGRREGGPLPPVLFRSEFPENWKLLLIFDQATHGLSGEKERLAFQTLPDFPETSSADLCRIVLMKTLPALIEQRLDEFGASLNRIQRVVGDYFAPMQGARFTSPAVAGALAWLEGHGIGAVGQSSWGPTGFAIVEGETRAYELVRQMKSQLNLKSLRYHVVSARNRGADLHTENESEESVLQWPEIEAAALVASIKSG